MLISELIVQLEKLKEKHGDRCVHISEWNNRKQTVKKREIDTIFFSDMDDEVSISFDLYRR